MSRKPSAPARRTGAEAASPSESGAGIGTFVARMQVEPRVQPSASDIQVDMPLPDILKQYGEPDFMASWSNAGSLNQKLLYIDGRALLEVNIRNGHVVSTAD